MKLIYVEDEIWLVKRFRMECEAIAGIDLCGCFDTAESALTYANEHEIHCAFLDVELSGMSGLALADHLRRIHPGIVIIFLSAHEKYMIEAIRCHHADYYLLKPYNSEQFRQAIERAKLLLPRRKKRIYIETLNGFNVYLDEKKVEFPSKVAKEILAFLVDSRGTVVSNKDLFLGMYEDLDDSHENMARIRKGLVRLRDILAKEGMRDLLVSVKSNHRVDTDMFECDVYKFLDGSESVSDYRGNYLPEYKWSEATNVLLKEKKLRSDFKKRI